MTNPIKKLAAGFTLLEILIALLIISIGLLGVATLQIRGQQFNQVSYLRTQATLLAYDLMDRIRTNFAINATNMAIYNVPSLVNVGPSGEIQGLVKTCDTAPCGTAVLTNYDLDNWFYYLRDTLPGGQAQIIPGVNNSYTITIQWQDIVDDGNNQPEKQQWTLQL